MELRYLILFIMPLLGGTIAFMFRMVKQQQLKLFLAFSGAFLFSITILEILPSIFSHSGSASIGFFILVGFFFQIAIEQFTRGIEHGHVHTHEQSKGIPFMVIAGLCLHSFIEGMPMGNNTILDENQRHNLIYGIALHEAPAAFALITLLRQHQVRSLLLIAVLIIYSSMSLMGIAWSHTLTSIIKIPDTLFENILAIVVGTFLHISTTILFENSTNHRFGLYKTIAIGIGVGLALLAS